MKKKNQNDVSCMACLNKAPGVLILSLLIALFSLLSLPTNVMAQPTKTIKGKVISKSGELLPGVSIVVKGTTTGTISDVDGNYTLTNVKPNSTLVYSFIGFTSS